jgi:hypothetical protein
MKVGVIGSRTFIDYELLEKTLDGLEISSIVSGGARGADSLAEKYASSRGIELIVFNADWSIGKRAAAIRNIKIVEGSDLIVAFWDGNSKGTKMTINMAISKDVDVLIVDI